MARRNPETGKWIPVHAVKFNEDGSISLLGEHAATSNPRGRNPKVGGVRFILTKLRINKSGYEQSSRPGGGKYYGVGAPVYHYADWETGDISGEFRAHSRQDAIERLKSIVANKV